MKRDLVVFVVALAVLCLLLSIKFVGFFTPDQTSNRQEMTRSTSWFPTTRKARTTEADRTQAYLVPVTHLTSKTESFDPQSEIEAAIPNEYLDEMEGEIPTKLRSMDSTEAVVEYVSRTPGAVGLERFSY